MRRVLAALLALAAGTLTAAEPSTVRVPTGTLVEGMLCLADPSQTYTLYLPRGYTPDVRWPALLLFDPLGRSRLPAEIFEPAAARWGWLLLSSNDTRSDGPWDPNVRALNALERAVAEGFQDAERMRNDPDLAVLAGTDEFREIVDGLGR